MLCRLGIACYRIHVGFKAGNNAGFGSMLVDFQFAERLSAHDVGQHLEHKGIGAAAEVGESQTVKLGVFNGYSAAGDELALVVPVGAVRIFLGVDGFQRQEIQRYRYHAELCQLFRYPQVGTRVLRHVGAGEKHHAELATIV